MVKAKQMLSVKNREGWRMTFTHRKITLRKIIFTANFALNINLIAIITLDIK